MTTKKRPGRPALFDSEAERKTVHLPAPVIDKLAKLGDGNLSRGIAAASYRVPDKPKPPKSRYVVVTDPAEIEAIERAGLRDPIGGFLNGQWFAESQSLAQFRGGTKYKVKA